MWSLKRKSALNSKVCGNADPKCICPSRTALSGLLSNFLKHRWCNFEVILKFVLKNQTVLSLLGALYFLLRNAWNTPYNQLLKQACLPDLTTRRKHLHFCSLYKLINGVYLHHDLPLVLHSLIAFTIPSSHTCMWHPYGLHYQMPLLLHVFKNLISLYS